MPDWLYRGMILRSLVREARKRGGLTQAALAQRAGVPQSTVSRIESGSRVPSTDLVEKLVRAAGFDIHVSLAEHDEGTAALFERTLKRTPDERLADATRAANFVLRARSALKQQQRG